MNSKLILLVCMLFITTLVCGQEYKRNNYWAVGYDPVVKFNFNFGLQIDTVQNVNMPVSVGCVLESASSISDTNGLLLMFSNGFVIYDSSGYAMNNGVLVNCPFGSVLANYYGGHSLFDQTSIILPKKGNTYYVFSTGMSDSVANNYINHTYTEFDVLNYSVVDMDSNAGQGKVVQKNIVVADKQHYVNCAMQAVKHSNGKDWWLVKADCTNNRYQEYYIKEDTILGPYYQNITDTGNFCTFFSQIYFNQDGTQMASGVYGQIVNGTYSRNRVDIYDFDRCNGTLTYKKHFIVPYDTISYPNRDAKSGICFSPNGKLMYMSNMYTIYQIDLEDTNTFNATLIAAPDTSILNFSWYNLMDIAPDGKIYIGSYSGNRFMRTIENPNVKGLSCNFYSHGAWQPYTYLLDPPNMPNYGLGADTSVICWPLQNENVKEKEKDWVVYPNPTYQNIYIKNARGKKKTLYNLSGQIISSTTKEEIDVSKYAKGLYFIQIENAVKKIIIE